MRWKEGKKDPPSEILRVRNDERRVSLPFDGSCESNVVEHTEEGDRKEGSVHD